MGDLAYAVFRRIRDQLAGNEAERNRGGDRRPEVTRTVKMTRLTRTWSAKFANH
jgi:hypothetical protein